MAQERKREEETNTNLYINTDENFRPLDPQKCWIVINTSIVSEYKPKREKEIIDIYRIEGLSNSNDHRG